MKDDNVSLQEVVLQSQNVLVMEQSMMDNVFKLVDNILQECK